MDNTRQVDVPTLLNSIAGQLSQSQDGIDQVSGSTHGHRMAAAFRTAAEAASQAGSDDAGEQLHRAAAAMRQQGQGVAAGYYADGLDSAAAQFQGQRGISLDSVLPFLQSFVGGVQSNNPAQPGQGTMLDALVPALGALGGAQSSGNPQGGIMDALGAAMSGAQNTGQGGQMDPGAASAANVIGGIVAALAPTLINAFLSSQQQQGQGAGGLGGLLGGQPAQGGYGGYGGSGYAPPQGGYTPPQGAADPFGGLGGLLGGLFGGGGQPQQGQDQGGDLGGLLGGLFGGQDSGGQSAGPIPNVGGGTSTQGSAPSVGGYGKPPSQRSEDVDAGASTNFGDVLRDLRDNDDNR